MGGLYTKNGDLIFSSMRKGGYGGDHVISIAPDYIPCKKNNLLKGRSIYLGPLMGHYGHFLIETLSRMLVFNLEEFDNIVFSKFIWGAKLQRFHKEFLQYFKIDNKNIIVLENNITFEELYIPQQLWNINRKPNLLVKDIYSFIRSKIYNKDVNRVFLTYTDKNNSRIKNLIEVEMIFKKYGFDIIEPERLSIREQLEIYKNAKILAGASGTAMHNCLFSKKGACTIELGDSRSPEDYMHLQKEINELNLLNSNRINFVGKNGKFDISTLEQQLQYIIKEKL
jgi:capsular polysaccharide biosynthesis protein